MSAETDIGPLATGQIAKDLEKQADPTPQDPMPVTETPKSPYAQLMDLVTPFATVTCADAAGTAMSCTGATIPATVSLALTIQDPDSGSGSPYEVTLTGQRRQT